MRWPARQADVDSRPYPILACSWNTTSCPAQLPLVSVSRTVARQHIERLADVKEDHHEHHVTIYARCPRASCPV